MITVGESVYGCVHSPQGCLRPVQEVLLHTLTTGGLHPAAMSGTHECQEVSTQACLAFFFFFPSLCSKKQTNTKNKIFLLFDFSHFIATPLKFKRPEG